MGGDSVGLVKRWSLDNIKRGGLIMITELRNKMDGRKIFPVLGLSLFLLVWLSGHGPAWGQEEGYPNKPIKIVIPYEPGGLTDLAIRVMTDYLSQEFKVPMVIENRAGAGGMIGASAVLKAKPDGYTVLGTSDSSMTIGPLESPNPPYDSFKDFLPICAYGGTPVAFGVHKSSPYNTLADLVKAAKETPGKLTVALSPIGGENHLIFEIFKRDAGVNIKLVPTTGTGPGFAALLGKHVDMLVISYIAFLPYVKSGEVKLLAAGASIPGSSIPNFAEAGYPKASMPRFDGFYASAKTLKPIYEKLVLSFKNVANNPDLRRKLENIGLIPAYKSPAECTDSLKEKWATYSKLIDDLGLKQK
jgi:tripartite-type tricarboxylate transporter receptor subunit TctC